MRLSTKGRYAVMAMADLARQGGESRAVTLADIAGRQDISVSYLEQLFSKLRRNGLVASARGPGGGYRLARPAHLMAVAEIVQAVEEPIQATACEAGGVLSCQGRTERCITHDLWHELTRHIESFLADVTLADVIENRIRGRASGPALAIAAE
jgi:Rrf2 family transcriptional regulator, iron-sulfur cluster assembly transcription factor